MVVRKFEDSPLSVKEFCKTHQINQGNFHKWRSRYKADAFVKPVNATGFARVDVMTDMPAQAELFAEVRGIKIYRPVSSSFLKDLL